MKSKWKSFV